MKTIKIPIIVLLILIFYFLFSCNKDEQINYPIEPHLDFKKIEIDKVLDVLGNNYEYFGVKCTTQSGI
ncbi:MAG: hypothetical protein K9H49_09760 [Bacteroidales bacterium]|nr:hypothetical protein [Bacteroidales bacterium]MCF8389940.1 hypothetical protein [Bacteroidales bacterium]